MTCKTSYTFSAESFKPAFKLHFRQGGYLRFIFRLVLDLFVIACGIVYCVTNRNMALGGVFIVLGAALLIRDALAYRWSYRMLRRTPFHGREMEAEIDEEAYYLRSEGLDIKMEWNLVKRVVVGDEGALIYQNKRQFHWFPFVGAEPVNAREIFERVVSAHNVDCKTLS